MSSYAPGSLRVWDGTTWRYASTDWQVPTHESMKAGANTGLAVTTTTCTKSVNVLHAGSAVTLTGSTTGRNGGTLEFYYRVGSAGTWTLLASRAAPAAGGNATATHTPTANGTSYYVKFTGSPTHLGSNSAATSGVTVQTHKTTTKIVPVGWVQAYGGQNKKVVGSSRDTAIHQGFYSSTYGNRKSLLRFNPALPAGASVSRVIFDCNSGWAHWYYGSGGTIIIGSFVNQDTEPATMDGVQIFPNRSRKEVGEGSFEVDITSWANTSMVNPAFSGILIGPGPSTSREFDGYSILAPAGNFSLRVTYSYWS